jgi:hypothetical protein
MELEQQICTAKQAGEEKKLEKLQMSVVVSENEILDNAANLLDH